MYLPGSEDTEGEEGRISVYHQLDEKSKEDGHETFWERVMEHVSDSQAYHQGANSFGTNLRELTEGVESDWAETVLRESYMRHQIKNAVERGIAPEDIVVVTGSYHVEGLKDWEGRDRRFVRNAKDRCQPYFDAVFVLSPFFKVRIWCGK